MKHSSLSFHRDVPFCLHSVWYIIVGVRKFFPMPKLNHHLVQLGSFSLDFGSGVKQLFSIFYVDSWIFFCMEWICWIRNKKFQMCLISLLGSAVSVPSVSLISAQHSSSPFHSSRVSNRMQSPWKGPAGEQGSHCTHRPAPSGSRIPAASAF